MSSLTQTSSTSLAPFVWAVIRQYHFSADTFRANGQVYSVSVWATTADNSVRATIYGTRSLGENVGTMEDGTKRQQKLVKFTLTHWAKL